MNQICPRNHYQLSKVKFQNNDIFLSVCQSGDEDEVEELLKKRSDINSSNIDGVTALHQVWNFLNSVEVFLFLSF